MEENEEINSCAGSCHSCSGCGHDHPEDYESNGMSPIITLTDDEGNDVRFEILDVVVMEDEKEYLIVSEAKENKEDDVEVVILEIKEENGEEVYDTVTDDEVAQAVFDEFVKQQDSEEE